jgi:hypothetical protein
MYPAAIPSRPSAYHKLVNPGWGTLILMSLRLGDEQHDVVARLPMEMMCPLTEGVPNPLARSLIGVVAAQAHGHSPPGASNGDDNMLRLTQQPQG